MEKSLMGGLTGNLQCWYPTRREKKKSILVIFPHNYFDKFYPSWDWNTLLHFTKRLPLCFHSLLHDNHPQKISLCRRHCRISACLFLPSLHLHAEAKINTIWSAAARLWAAVNRSDCRTHRHEDCVWFKPRDASTGRSSLVQAHHISWVERWHL